MLVALITDTHFGARSDNSLFYEYFNLFLNKCFFPTLEHHGITKIIHLGDFLDRRKYVNFNTLNWIKTNFLDKTKKYDIDLIIGNHDTYYKNTNQLNSPNLITSEYSNITVYSEPTEVDGILYLPWINSENHDSSMKMINDSSSEVIMGHLEINGYVMHKGVLCSGGLNPEIFNKFKSVYTGHFHTKNQSANIYYLGCPWDLMFTDSDDVKGFHLYDTETDELQFIENPYKMFWKFYYDDKSKTKEAVLLPDSKLRKLIKSFVKVYVKSKTKPKLFDTYIKQINEAQPASLILFEEYANIETEQTDIINMSEDTLSIIRSSINDYSDLINGDESKKRIEDLLTKIYIESIKE